MKSSCAAMCDILDIISSLSPFAKSHTPASHLTVYSTTIHTNVFIFSFFFFLLSFFFFSFFFFLFLFFFFSFFFLLSFFFFLFFLVSFFFFFCLDEICRSALCVWISGTLEQCASEKPVQERRCREYETAFYARWKIIQQVGLKSNSKKLCPTVRFTS